MELFRGYVYAPNIKTRLHAFLKNFLGNKKPVLLCLGTDKILADCLAPLTADLLRNQNFPCYIYGGLKSPITKQNAEYASEFINTIHKNSPIIVLDSMTTFSQSRLGHIIATDNYTGTFHKLKINADLYLYGITSLLKNNLLANARLQNIQAMAEVFSFVLTSLFTEKNTLHKFKTCA
ncbi:MAG: DUF1256 domain-containing protein [Clostridia bacterium]|nr:DUF1256 domain-containing protein [Clostridia bacterium]